MFVAMSMFMKLFSVFVLTGVILVGCCDKNQKYKLEEDSSQFVTISDVVPVVILEIRYFSTYNFVGTRVDGYMEPTALLTS